MENMNSWYDIDWPKVNNNVYLLQMRIFRASKDQNWEKVFKIQKLFIRSASAKYLAVRKVMQDDNNGKTTLEIDDKTNVSKKERFELFQNLFLKRNGPVLQKVKILKKDEVLKPLETFTMGDRALQTLALMALSPQWEAHFEPSSYGFRPGRSVFDAMEAVFLSIYKKQKWVLNADISKCFERINHEVLIKKCNTFPEMEKQIKVWLQAGILEREHLTQSLEETLKKSPMVSLLVNIALNGLETELADFARTLPGYKKDNEKALSFVRHGDNFLVMHQDIVTLRKAKEIVTEFLKSLGLELNEGTTKIVHTEDQSEEHPPGFNYLGFHVVHRKKWIQIRKAKKVNPSNRNFITIITPSEESVKFHKKEIRDIIKSSFGLSQEKLIKKLNPVIRAWALSKRTQMSSGIFQELDSYLFLQTWKWSRRRHITLSRMTLKEKYYRKVGNRNWVFSFEKKKEDKTLNIVRLQAYSDIRIQRYLKVKGTESVYNGNILYWSQRASCNPLLSNTIAKLIKEQSGKCSYCGRNFLPNERIERYQSEFKSLDGKLIRNNVQVIHDYCHLVITHIDLEEIYNRKIFLKTLPGAE